MVGTQIKKTLFTAKGREFFLFFLRLQKTMYYKCAVKKAASFAYTSL